MLNINVCKKCFDCHFSAYEKSPWESLKLEVTDNIFKFEKFDFGISGSYSLNELWGKTQKTICLHEKYYDSYPYKFLVSGGGYVIENRKYYWNILHISSEPPPFCPYALEHSVLGQDDKSEMTRRECNDNLGFTDDEILQLEEEAYMNSDDCSAYRKMGYDLPYLTDDRKNGGGGFIFCLYSYFGESVTAKISDSVKLDKNICKACFDNHMSKGFLNPSWDDKMNFRPHGNSPERLWEKNKLFCPHHHKPWESDYVPVFIDNRNPPPDECKFRLEHLVFSQNIKEEIC